MQPVCKIWSWKTWVHSGFNQDQFYMWHLHSTPNHSCSFIVIYYLWQFGFLLFFFFFCVPSFSSIHRANRGTISWSVWCSELWCRHLGSARKAKQWLWCVIYSQAVTVAECIKNHLAVGFFTSSPPNAEKYSESRFILLSLPLVILLFYHNLNKALFFHFWFDLLFVRPVFCLFCLHHFISLGFGFL